MFCTLYFQQIQESGQKNHKLKFGTHTFKALKNPTIDQYIYKLSILMKRRNSPFSFMNLLIGSILKVCL
jgi:hypothetical protein